VTKFPPGSLIGACRDLQKSHTYVHKEHVHQLHPQFTLSIQIAIIPNPIIMRLACGARVHNIKCASQTILSSPINLRELKLLCLDRLVENSALKLDFIQVQLS
jgi:hypothetical protein